MANKVEDLVNVILDSYNECDITARICLTRIFL